jgi:DnaJ-class molecular chaperone
MQCPSCGEILPDESQFCNHCGKPVTVSAAVPMGEPDGVSVHCARCEGTGKQSGMFGESDCPACRGKGTVLVAAPPRKCPLCGGTGRQEGFINKAVCGVCWGTGWAEVLK